MSNNKSLSVVRTERERERERLRSSYIGDDINYLFDIYSEVRISHITGNIKLKPKERYITIIIWLTSFSERTELDIS